MHHTRSTPRHSLARDLYPLVPESGALIVVRLTWPSGTVFWPSQEEQEAKHTEMSVESMNDGDDKGEL